MLACKSFNPTSEMPAIHRWFHILAEELASRIAADYELHQRRPCSLVVHYRCALAPAYPCMSSHFWYKQSRPSLESKAPQGIPSLIPGPASARPLLLTCTHAERIQPYATSLPQARARPAFGCTWLHAPVLRKQQEL